MKKILVSDYDGTLFTDEIDLFQNIKKIENFQEKGNIFIIATSRSYTSILEEVQKYQIPYDFIFSNVGAGIFDSNGTILYADFIPEYEKNKIENILEYYTQLDITRFGILEPQEKESKNIVGYKIKGELELLEKLEILFKRLLSNFDVSLKRGEHKLFLNYSNNTKEKAIFRLLDMFPDYKDFEIVTVGDDDVDFGMLKQFDGYRMEFSSKLLAKNIVKMVSSVGELV